MATCKVITQHHDPRYQAESIPKFHDPASYQSLVSYVLRDYTLPRECVGARSLDLNRAAWEMEQVALAFDKYEGVKVRHMVISFLGEELMRMGKNKAEILEEVRWFAEYVIGFYGRSYQILYGVHTDTDHLHIHIGMSTVNYRTGYKYPGTKADYYAFQNHVNEWTKENYGFHVVFYTDKILDDTTGTDRNI